MWPTVTSGACATVGRVCTTNLFFCSDMTADFQAI